MKILNGQILSAFVKFEKLIGILIDKNAEHPTNARLRRPLATSTADYTTLMSQIIFEINEIN